MGFWGGFSQGISQIPGILQRNQQMELQREEHQLKAKMLQYQIKKEEAAQQEDEQQRRGMADYRQAATFGVPDQFGGPVQGPIEESGRLPAQPAPQRQATPQELYGLSLGAVRPQDAVRLIQQQQKAETPGAGNAAFADVPSALAFQNSPEFKTAFPTGARLQQSSKGWTFQGVNPVNVAANEFHRVFAQTNDINQAVAAYNAIQFGGAAMQGAGRELGGAAAIVPGASIPPPPQFTQPQGQPQPQAAPPRIHQGFPGANQPAPTTQPAPTAQPGSSLPLQAKELGSQANKRGSNKAEAEETIVGLSSAMDLVNELDQLSSQIFTGSKASGYGQRAVGAVGEYARSWDPASMEGMYEARKQTVGENLARQIGGVKGTATEGDIYRMLVALPKVGKGETKESRDYKIGAFRQIIQLAIDKKQRYINGEPIDLNQSKQEFNKMVTQFLAGTYKPPKGRLVPLQGGQ